MFVPSVFLPISFNCLPNYQLFPSSFHDYHYIHFILPSLAKEYAQERKHDYADQLERIQCILQDIASLLATPRSQQPISKFF